MGETNHVMNPTYVKGEFVIHFQLLKNEEQKLQQCSNTDILLLLQPDYSCRDPHPLSAGFV